VPPATDYGGAALRPRLGAGHAVCFRDGRRFATMSRSPLGRYAYGAFGLALLPLALQLTRQSDFQQRIVRTVTAHPELAPMFERENLTMSELLHAIPGGRLEGAHLSYDTFAHWGYGLAAALVFLGVIALLFDRGAAKV